MNAHKKRMYWLTNDEWFRLNPITNKFELTDKATPLARESFKEWKRPRINWRYIWDSIIYRIKY